MLRLRPVALILLSLAALCHAQPTGTLHQTKSDFNGKIAVEQDFRGIRSLVFEDGATQSCLDTKDPGRLVLPYTRAAMTALAFHPEPKRILIVGLGGGSMPMFLRQAYPDLLIDNVEIDPVVVKMAKDYFGFAEDDKVKAIVGDGRKFIETTENRYDIIFLDAFGSDDIPYALATKEFLAAVRSRLAPGGIVAANIWSEMHNKLYGSMLKTYLAVFDELHIIRAPEASGNRIVVVLPRKANMTRTGLMTTAAEVQKKHMPKLDLPGMIDQGYMDSPHIAASAKVLLDSKE